MQSCFVCCHAALIEHNQANQIAEVVLVAEGDWNELSQDRLDWLKQLTEAALSDKKLNGHPGWKAYAADVSFFQELSELYQVNGFGWLC